LALLLLMMTAERLFLFDAGELRYIARFFFWWRFRSTHLPFTCFRCLYCSLLSSTPLGFTSFKVVYFLKFLLSLELAVKQRTPTQFPPPNLFAICSDTFCKWCVGKRRRVEECSVALLHDKKAKTFVWLSGEKRVQTNEKYKLRLTTEAYKLSYNYINYTINLVGRSFDKWRRRRLRSCCSRRVRRMSFGCAVRRAL
jgi:hypothetical protein